MTTPPNSAEPVSATTKARPAPDYVQQVSEAIERNDAAALRALAGDLHESDTGDVIEALDPELARASSSSLAASLTSPRSPRSMTPSARKSLRSCRRRPWLTASAISIPTMPPTFSKTCRKMSRPRFWSSCRAWSGAPSGASWTTRKAPPAAACRRSSSRCRRHGPSARRSTICAKTVELPDRFYELYVIDDASKLLGAVALDLLLRNKRPQPLRADGIPSAGGCAPPKTRRRWRACSSATISSPRPWWTGDKLVGVLTFDDIVDVIEEEAEEDIKALGGVGRSEELSDWAGPSSNAVFLGR